ncbi:MAG: AI-2E family transporter, partial [Lachnospira pectinoschiza]
VYVWPFVIGVFIAVILEKKVIYLSDKLYIGLDKLLVWNKRITIKKKKCQGIAATIIVSLIFVVLLALFSFIIFKGVDEFSRLLRNLDYNLIAVKQLTARMCFDADAFLGLEGGCCLESLIACGHKLMSIMPEKIILISAPVVKNIVIIVGGIVVCFIAVIYLVSDLQKFRDNIRQVVFYEEIRMIWKEVRRLINIYFKVQLRIMLINSGLCMLAFAILKNPYAIVLGIIIGIIDALPVFGTGTVLIPWILISFLIRNYRYAVILLMAYIITYFVREIMESKSMGDRLGISPFTMLVIIFTGLLVYGVAGFITGPVSYVIIKALVIRLRCEMGIE